MGTRSRLAKWRLIVLIGVLVCITAAGAAHTVRVRYHEGLLLQLGHEIVEEYNETDPIPVSEEGQEADVEIETHCAFEYLVFGEMSGKIRLIVTPRPHAPVQEEFAIAYICVYEDGKWRYVESYHEH